MYLEIFLADFAVFCFFLGILRDFGGPRPREISEALTKCHAGVSHSAVSSPWLLYQGQKFHSGMKSRNGIM